MPEAGEGTMANFVALAAARNWRTQREDVDLLVDVVRELIAARTA